MIDALDSWREVKRYTNWDEADAQRAATIRDNPSLDVRLRASWGWHVLEIRRIAR